MSECDDTSAALARERAAHALTREALREAQARWQALEDARVALSGVQQQPGVQ